MKSASTTMSVRLLASEKKRLQRLAAATDRPATALASKAISDFLDLNEWQIAGIEAASQSLDGNDFVEHSDMKKWVRAQTRK